MGATLVRAATGKGAAASSVAAVAKEKRGTGERDKKKETTGSRSQQDTDVQLPPLIILKDCGAQTVHSYAVKDARDKEPGRLMNKLSLYLGLVSFLYGLLCLAVAHNDFLQTILVYRNYPTQLTSSDELQDLVHFGLLSARNIQQLRDDGVRLRGWHVSPMPTSELPLLANISQAPASVKDVFYDAEMARGRRPIVIYLHGNTANRALPYRIDMMKQLANTVDAHVIAFDYAGFGDSEGWPSEESTSCDAMAICKWTQETIRRGRALLQDRSRCNLYPIHSCSSHNEVMETPRIYVYGHSLGSSIAINLAVEMNTLGRKERSAPLSGVILDAAFTSFPDAVASHPNSAIFRVFPFTQNYILANLKNKYESITKISKVSPVPMLLLHGTEDDKIPPSHSEKLYQSLLDKEHAKLVLIDQGNHINNFQHTQWITEVFAFTRPSPREG